ncbi:lysostaphin resistance A-like protein [Chloroflexota bacterium]
MIAPIYLALRTGYKRSKSILRPFTTTIITYLVLLTIAELLTSYLYIEVGMLLHSVLMMALIVHSSAVSEQTTQHMLLALSLAPMIRILALASPLIPFSPIYWYLIISIPLLAATFVVIRNIHLPLAEIGFIRGSIRIQMLVAVSGVLFGTGEYLILSPLEGYESLITEFSLGTFWLPALILLIFTGFTEELIFRGLLHRVFWTRFGWWGVIYISLLFAVLHVGYHSIVDVVFVFVVGFIFAWIVKRTGSLLGVTLSHGITNIFLYMVMPVLSG